MLSGKNIVLTGANSGIGLAVLKRLMQGDNKILAVDLHINNIEQYCCDKVFVMQCDVSNKENVDMIFDTAIQKLGSIDIFYANAGYPYYEEINYADWDRTAKMFETNVFSPIYSYQKYRHYLNGKEGHFAITVSAIGKMAMPGFTLYSASKFAMQGFQQGLRLEMPSNIKLTCLYPIATNTGFFKAANEIEFEKPFPVQQPDHVAKAMIKGLEKGKKTVNPSKLFVFAEQLMKFCPPIRSIYWAMEKAKFKRFKAKITK